MEEPAYNGEAGRPQGTIEDRLDAALDEVQRHGARPALIHITRADWDELNRIWSERRGCKMIVFDHACVHLFPAKDGEPTQIEWSR